MNLHGRTPSFRLASVVQLAAAVLFVGVSSAWAQNTYEDLDGRFALDLPPGWQLQSEVATTLYQFARPNAPLIIVICQEELDDRESVFASAMGYLPDATPRPPSGTVFDTEVNGNPARWSEIKFEQDGVDLTTYIGGVAIEGTGIGVMYITTLNEEWYDSYGESLKQTFNSIRLAGAPVTGATALVAADVGYIEAAAEAEPVAEAASTFEHDLLTLTVPAGWSVERGEGASIAAIEHADIGTVAVMGLKKNDFGRNREEILEALGVGVQSAVPSMRSVRGPYEITTDAGDVILMQEYSGEVTAEGQSTPYVYFVASAKDRNRGLGFMLMCKPEVREDAERELLSIISSLGPGVER